jgi:hypothetical protein
MAEQFSSNVRVHELKCWPEYFGPVKAGIKPFEIRKDDRGYAVGDHLRLREWRWKDETYTGDEVTVRVTYLTGWAQQPEHVVMGIEPVPVIEPGALNVAPIARIEIVGGEISQTEVYAPGLPDGAHELFPVPLNPRGEMRPHALTSPPDAALATTMKIVGTMEKALRQIDDYSAGSTIQPVLVARDALRKLYGDNYRSTPTKETSR